MDPMFSGMEWTALEKEEARSIVARLSNTFDVVGTGNGNNDTRHDRIVSELEAWFPWKTKNEVIDLYVDTVVDMRQASVQPHDAGNVVHPTFDLMKDNFGMLPGEDAAMNSVDFGMNNYYGGAGMVFGDAPMGETVEKAPPVPVVVNDGNEVNQGGGRQRAAPNSGKSRFWTTDEHRMFLRGLKFYGRGDWKNISKFFVTSKTAVQVSSHAQKFFRRLERTDGKQRYSINDVGLYDNAADPLDNNYGGWQALAFSGGHLQPIGGYGAAGPHIAPPANTSSVAAMNNVAKFWAPLLYNPQTQQQFTQMQVQAPPQPQQAWNNQQMLGAAATPMEGETAWNVAPIEGEAAWNNQQMLGAAATPMEGEAAWNAAPIEEKAARNNQQMMGAAAAPMEGAADNFVPAGGAGYYQQEQGAGYDVPAESWMMNNNMF